MVGGNDDDEEELSDSMLDAKLARVFVAGASGRTTSFSFFESVSASTVWPSTSNIKSMGSPVVSP